MTIGCIMYYGTLQLYANMSKVISNSLYLDFIRGNILPMGCQNHACYNLWYTPRQKLLDFFFMCISCELFWFDCLMRDAAIIWSHNKHLPISESFCRFSMFRIMHKASIIDKPRRPPRAQCHMNRLFNPVDGFRAVPHSFWNSTNRTYMFLILSSH